MPAISVGSVEVDIVPSAKGIYAKLKEALEPDAAKAGKDAGEAAGKAFGPAMQGAVGDALGARIGQQIGQQIAARIAASIRDALRDGVTRGGQAARPAATRQGEETGGAFARSLRARLEAAFRSMPKLDVRLSDTGVDADLARLRARLETLTGKTIGIDVDAETARAEAADIEERLRRLGAAHPNVAVRADTAAAIAQLKLVQEEIDKVTANPARIRVETDGAFGQRLRAQVEAAERSLPNINLRADSSPAEREIASLRAQLTALKEQKVGIDIDAATARAKLDEIQARLFRLSGQRAELQVGADTNAAQAALYNIGLRIDRLRGQRPTIDVRVDAAAAYAQLAGVQALVNHLDGQSMHIDTSSSVSGMQMLVTAAIAFGPAIIPVLPVVAAGLGAIAAAATAAAAGIGGIALVAVPAFKQIGSVLQAQKAAQDAAANSSLRGGQAASQAAQRALQQASAAQSLATAQRNAARQIADAQRGITDAERQAAQANQQAAQQVKQARQSLADAYEQAADRMKQANAQVVSAEKDLAAAQKTARQTQVDLTQARKDAAQQLEDLNNRLTDSQLSQRDAEIALKEATAQRDQVLKAANSTELDKQKALLAYDQAVQRLKEQTTETARLKDETAAANQAGVDGSATVKDAQERAAQAQQEVTDKTQALKDAQADAAKVQIQNTRAIADAQEKLSAAQANVAETQRAGAEAVQVAQERLATAQQSAADSIASAQRQIASASLSAAGGVDQAAIAQAKYRAELAKLTPAARQTMNAYTGLKDAFSAWSRSLQPAVMPIFTRALVGMKNALPGLTPFVLSASDAVKGLQDRASAGFKKPWWKTFKKDLLGSVKPAITGLGVAFGNIFKGIVGIIDAFLPHMDGISNRMQSITKRFAEWGTHLKGSPEFERFLTYASQSATRLASAIGKIGRAFLSIGEALAPVSGPVLAFLGGLANGIGIVATHAPWLVQAIWGVIVVWRVWTLAVAAFNLVMGLNPFVQIGLLIFALIAIVVYAYNRFGWFRDGVQAVWRAIKAGASAVVDWFKGPFTRFFTVTIPGVFNTVLSWVKRNWPWILGALTGPIGLAVVAIIKYWGDIKHGFSSAWSWIKSNVLYPIRDFFTKTIPGWGNTLAAHMVGAFDNARSGIKTAWDKIKDIARKPVQFVVDTVYNNGIRKVWNLVTDAFGGKHLEPMKFATGGILPGYTPGKDVHLAALSGGEAIMRPEWTRAVGPGYVHAMNAAARTGGVTGVQQALGLPAFKDGGIFSGIGDVVSGAWDKVKKGASWLKDSFSGALKAGVEHVVNPLINKIPGGSIGFVGLLKDLMKGAVARLVGAGKTGDEKASPNVNYKAGAGVEQWRPVVLQSLREVGQPASLAGSTLRRMNQESGGNPTIVNKWDSNWQRGTPSVGLMQVIGPTFRSYAGKYRGKGPFLYGVSVDPLANIYSSMRYAMGAYGSLSRAYDRPGGYDSGGWMPPGMNLMYNGLGQPEAVLTPGQWNAIHGAATRGGDGAQQPVVVELHADEDGLGRFVDVRIHEHDQHLVQVINAS
ncbi:hypothetical protein G3I51_24425 [Streptomyces sp. SID9944]|nr:hypothetical protein [Streptomyces sp. SID9944]